MTVSPEKIAEMRSLIPRHQDGSVRSRAWVARVPAPDMDAILTELLTLRAERDEALESRKRIFDLGVGHRDRAAAAEAKLARQGEALKEAEALLEVSTFTPWLRDWCRRRFGKWITHNTAKGALNDLRARSTLSPEDSELTVSIVGDDLVIRIDAATLANAIKYMPKAEIFDEQLQDFFQPEVTDASAFLKEMYLALEHEEEDGSTLVHRMIDKAALHIMHVGGEGILSAQEVRDRYLALAKGAQQ